MKQASSIKVLAIASGGGHWVQLLRMRKAWDGCQATFVTTLAGYEDDLLKDYEARNMPTPNFYEIIDANRWQKFRLIRQLLQILCILLRVRPDVIISTGAAPGYFALRFGKFLGAKTIWVDSIANAEELSLSGQKVKSCADLWLTQWPELEGSLDKKNNRPEYKGAVV